MTRLKCLVRLQAALYRRFLNVAVSRVRLGAIFTPTILILAISPFKSSDLRFSPHLYYLLIITRRLKCVLIR
jgi:hypothetical protein